MQRIRKHDPQDFPTINQNGSTHSSVSFMLPPLEFIQRWGNERESERERVRERERESKRKGRNAKKMKKEAQRVNNGLCNQVPTINFQPGSDTFYSDSKSTQTQKYLKCGLSPRLDCSPSFSSLNIFIFYILQQKFFFFFWILQFIYCRMNPTERKKMLFLFFVCGFSIITRESSSIFVFFFSQKIIFSSDTFPSNESLCLRFHCKQFWRLTQIITNQWSFPFLEQMEEERTDDDSEKEIYAKSFYEIFFFRQSTEMKVIWI